MPSTRKTKRGEVLRSGTCWHCQGPAVGGGMYRRGIETIPLCPRCGPRKEMRDLYLDHAEAKRLLRAAKEHSIRAHLFVFLGLNLGLRISEACGMAGTDFDWDEGRVWVRTLKRKVKGRHPTLPVWMSPSFMKEAKRLMGRRKGYLFPRTRGGHGFKKGGYVSRWVLERLFHEVADLADLGRKVTAHSMRHYCAIRLLEETDDLYWVSRQLRHSSLKTTEQYLHLLPKKAKKLAGMVPVLK